MDYSYDDIKAVKNRVQKLFESTKIAHINLKASRKNLKNVQIKIKGVYDRFFSVTSMVGAYEESFTIKYIDILTKQISILELEW